jgi:hypothetical protein
MHGICELINTYIVSLNHNTKFNLVMEIFQTVVFKE